MSEVSTGAVPISHIGAPLAIGAALGGLVFFAAKYCLKSYEKSIENIERSNTRLKWLDEHVVSSPARMKEEALKLHKLISADSSFIEMVKELSISQKNILAGAIVTQNSPLRSYVPSIMEQMPENVNSFETELNVGIRNLALDNLKFVNNILEDAAIAAGFNKEIRILRQTESHTDIVFSDNENRRFTAYCKLNKEMNPSLALDLEGFHSDSDACTKKMDEIIHYLQTHGVPYTYKRIRHNQPMGVLREMINKKDNKKKREEMQTYLNGKNKVNTIIKKQR